MKKFIRNTALFILPFLPLGVISFSLLYIDIFKISGFYDDYYSNHFLTPNRELVCSKNYDQYKNVEKYNAFIFGSSRSNAFHCNQWKYHLPQTAKPFHFDASNEGTWGILKKLEYIQESKREIKDVLIILDESTFIPHRTKNRIENYLFISHPSISRESVISYYSTHIKTTLNIKFLSKIYSSYKKNKQSTSSKKHISNPKNGDLLYWQESSIQADSIAYYKDLIQKGVFYERTLAESSAGKISNAAIIQLKEIQKILSHHNTNYKIIISPLYDQISFKQDYLDILHSIFGKENVYNFSGKNEFTKSIGNYYEDSHYRPHVANKIMQLIYK